MIKYIHDAMAKKREALENNDKGFSLIELLVVVLILGILAAIAIPVFIGQQNAAADSAAQANLANAKVAAISHLISNDSLPANPSTALVASGWPQGDPAVTVAGSVPAAHAAATFCLTATSDSGTDFMTTDVSGIESGDCS